MVREALFALVEATIDGEPAPREALRVVNEAAAAPPPTPALQDAGSAGRATSTRSSPRSPAPRSSCSAAPSGRASSGAPARTARARSSTAHAAAGGAGAGWPAAATAPRRPPTAPAGASARLVGRAVEDDRPQPDVHGGVAAPAAARLRLPCGRPQCQPAAVQECAGSASCRTRRAPRSRLAAAGVDRPHVEAEPPPPPPPLPLPAWARHRRRTALLTTSSIRPRGQPTLASPLSRPPSSGVQLRPPARQAAARGSRAWRSTRRPPASPSCSPARTPGSRARACRPTRSARSASRGA